VSITTGTKLGQYEVQDFIGQGAMGLVYRAYHSQLERTGAVKVLQAIAPDRDTTARFRHEAQAIAQLRHPNIVNVYDFGEYQGTPYMIVEYVPGGSLADRLSSGQLEPAQALKYLRGIAAGLDYAHGMGVVHRDVKPANVLLEKDDTPVLADFGLAKLLQGSSIKSMSGVTTGTPAYMAPEQVTGSDVGPAADRYSLATIAYEMFARVIPFDGLALMELLYAHVHRDPLPPSVHNNSLSWRVDEVILRGLAKEPASRWESCTAFVDALAAALADKTAPVAARTAVMTPGIVSTVPLNRATAAVAMAAPTLAETVRPSATVAVPYPAPAQPAAKRIARRPFAIGAAALVLLLIFGVCGYIATHPTPTISLSPTTVTAGDTVVVTATHVPAHQDGTIQLLSARYDFSFRSDANGKAITDITIPLEIGAGDHTVKICWASRCHASATLHVLNPVALASPSPGATPTTAPGASPQPTGPPGQSPVPTGAASPRPGTTPTPAPKPTPTPPAPPPSQSIALVSVSVANGTKVTFFNFSAGTVAVCVWQNASCHSTNVAVPQGTNTLTFTTPVGILPTGLLAGQAHITVGSLTSNSVNVTA
jgi:serine/threonine-protein kinase